MARLLSVLALLYLFVMIGAIAFEATQNPLGVLKATLGFGYIFLPFAAVFYTKNAWRAFWIGFIVVGWCKRAIEPAIAMAFSKELSKVLSQDAFENAGFVSTAHWLYSVVVSIIGGLAWRFIYIRRRQRESQSAQESGTPP